MAPAPEMQDVKLADQLLCHDIQYFLVDVRDFVKERAALQLDFSKRLEGLARKYESRRDKLDVRRNNTLATAGIQVVSQDAAVSTAATAIAGLGAPACGAPTTASLTTTIPANTDAGSNNNNNNNNNNGSGIDALALGDSAVSLSETTVAHRAWDAVLGETIQSAKCHASLAESLSHDIAERLKIVASKRDEARKKHLTFAQRLLLEREKAEAEVTRAKQKYDDGCDAVEAAKLRFERGPDEKSKEKLKRLWHQEILDMNNAKNTYLLAIKTANASKAKHYHDDVPGLLDDMRDLGQSIIGGVKTIWQQYVQLHIDAINSHLADFEAVRAAVDAIDPASDVQVFNKSRQHGIAEPADLPYIPCGLWQDTNEIVTDEFSVVYLRNRLAKIRTRLDEVEQEMSTKSKGIKGMDTLVRAYTANPQQGDADDVRETMLDAKRELVMLATVQRALVTQIDEIVQAVGEYPPGCRQHNFKLTSFTIPTACDYCQQTIWGVAKTDLSCKDCAYNAHVKCELKIAPSCSGVKSLPKMKRVLSGPSRVSSQKVASPLPPPPVPSHTVQPPSYASPLSAQTPQGTYAAVAGVGNLPEPARTLSVLHTNAHSATDDTRDAQLQHSPSADLPLPPALPGSIAPATPALAPASEPPRSAGPPTYAAIAASGGHVARVEPPCTPALLQRSSKSGASSSSSLPDEPLHREHASPASVPIASPSSYHVGGAAMAMYDYASGSSDEISVSKGDIVMIAAPDDGSGWTTVIKHGSRGMVPSSYIEPLASRAPSTASALALGPAPMIADASGGMEQAASAQPAFENTRTSTAAVAASPSASHAAPLQVEAATASALPAPLAAPRKATALYDYIKNSPDELTIYTGDVVIVQEPDDGSGWTAVQRDKHQGLVPTTYLDFDTN